MNARRRLKPGVNQHGSARSAAGRDMVQELSGWKTRQEFRSAQQEIVLPVALFAATPDDSL